MANPVATTGAHWCTHLTLYFASKMKKCKRSVSTGVRCKARSMGRGMKNSAGSGGEAEVGSVVGF